MSEQSKTSNIESKANEIAFKVIDNKMAVLMSCTVNIVDNPTFIDIVKHKLRFLKITAKPDIAAIEVELEKAKAEKRGIEKLKIAQGTQPVNGVDGRIAWTRDYFQPGYYVDPKTKRIDFHQKMSDPCVEQDEILVKVFKAKPGKNGINVFGHALTVPNPKDVTINAGTNVYWDESVSGFRASCPGTVQLHGQTLEVNDVYNARSGVNPGTGNIKHNGKVVVNGDIDADFKIEATGDIEVKGLVYASDIVCGGNLVTREGINGSQEKQIKVDGDILTKYIQNSVVEAKGNITANSEIYQCTVNSFGEVIVKEGRIVAGEVAAVKGITVGEAGSKGSIKTILIAGVDKILQKKIQVNHEEIKRLKGMMKQLETVHVKLKRNKKILNEAQRKMMVEIEQKLAEGDKEIERINTANKLLYDKKRLREEVPIRIMKVAYPGTILRIGDCCHRIDHTLLGPIVAKYSRHRDEIVLTSEVEDEVPDIVNEELPETTEQNQIESPESETESTDPDLENESDQN